MAAIMGMIAVALGSMIGRLLFGAGLAVVSYEAVDGILNILQSRMYDELNAVGVGETAVVVEILRVREILQIYLATAGGILAVKSTRIFVGKSEH